MWPVWELVPVKCKNVNNLTRFQSFDSIFFANDSCTQYLVSVKCPAHLLKTALTYSRKSKWVVLFDTALFPVDFQTLYILRARDIIATCDLVSCLITWLRCLVTWPALRVVIGLCNSTVLWLVDVYLLSFSAFTLCKIETLVFTTNFPPLRLGKLCDEYSRVDFTAF